MPGPPARLELDLVVAGNRAAQGENGAVLGLDPGVCRERNRARPGRNCVCGRPQGAGIAGFTPTFARNGDRLAVGSQPGQELPIGVDNDVAQSAQSGGRRVDAAIIDLQRAGEAGAEDRGCIRLAPTARRR